MKNQNEKERKIKTKENDHLKCMHAKTMKTNSLNKLH